MGDHTSGWEGAAVGVDMVLTQVRSTRLGGLEEVIVEEEEEEEDGELWYVRTLPARSEPKCNREPERGAVTPRLRIQDRGSQSLLICEIVNWRTVRKQKTKDRAWHVDHGSRGKLLMCEIPKSDTGFDI